MAKIQSKSEIQSRSTSMRSRTISKRESRSRTQKCGAAVRDVVIVRWCSDRFLWPQLRSTCSVAVCAGDQTRACDFSVAILHQDFQVLLRTFSPGRAAAHTKHAMGAQRNAAEARAQGR